MNRESRLDRDTHMGKDVKSNNVAEAHRNFGLYQEGPSVILQSYAVPVTLTHLILSYHHRSIDDLGKVDESLTCGSIL